MYDYFIKDHLGNVRSTVTAQPINAAYLAGHEISMANVEQLIFDNIPNVRDGKPGSINPNDGMAAGLVAEVSDKRIGTAVLLKVMPGDRFTIDAQSYYEDEYTGTETVGSNDVVESLLSVLLGGNTYAGVPIGELPENARTIKQIFEAPNLAEKLSTIVPSNYNAAAPKAHLNYLFFNDDLQLVADLSGKIQVSPNGIGTGGWQAVGTGTEICNCTAVNPGSSGYIAIYVDNQSIGKKVWFDDLHIEHYTSEVLEEDHYYPFGLTVGIGQTAQGNLPGQPYKYQGIELERHLGLEIYETFYRGLDPQLGRFMQIDPKADVDYHISPYAAMGNNPVSNTDPAGDLFFGLFGSTSEQRKAASGFASANNGEVQNKWSSSIHVNYSSASPDADGTAGVLTSEQYFRKDGSSIPQNGEITQHEPGLMEKWSESGDPIGYPLVNSFYVTGQNLFTKSLRGDDMAFNLGGGVTSTSDNIDAFVTAGTALVPGPSAAGIKSGEIYRMSFKELQTAVKSKSTEMRAFFETGDVTKKSILDAYKELSKRIIRGTDGAPARKASETGLKVQSERVDQINKALGH